MRVPGALLLTLLTMGVVAGVSRGVSVVAAPAAPAAGPGLELGLNTPAGTYGRGNMRLAVKPD